MEAKYPVTKAVCAALGQYRRAGESCFRWVRLHAREQEAVRTLAANTRDLDSLPTAPERAARILEGLEVRVAPSLLAGAVWGTESRALEAALAALMGEKRPVHVGKGTREPEDPTRWVPQVRTDGRRSPLTDPPPYDPARRKVDPLAEWRREAEFNSGGRITFNDPLPEPEEEPMEVKPETVEVSNQPVSSNGKEPAPLSARERLTAMVDAGKVDISQYLPTAQRDRIAATLGVTGSRVGQIVKALREERGIQLGKFVLNRQPAQPAGVEPDDEPQPPAAESAEPAAAEPQPQPQPALTNWTDEQLADAPKVGQELRPEQLPMLLGVKILHTEPAPLENEEERQLALYVAAGLSPKESEPKIGALSLERRLAVLERAAAVIRTVTR